MVHMWVHGVLAAARVLGLNLSARKGFVLSQIDGATDVHQLGQLAGLAPEEVRAVLERLVREGAIEPPEGPSTAPLRRGAVPAGPWVRPATVHSADPPAIR